MNQLCGGNPVEISEKLYRKIPLGIAEAICSICTEILDEIPTVNTERNHARISDGILEVICGDIPFGIFPDVTENIPKRNSYRNS